MAGLAPLQLCHTTEIELQRIAGCAYSDIETGRNTYKVAEAIQRHTRTDLTEIVSAMPVKPGDLNCSTVDVRVKYIKPDCGQDSMSCDDVLFDCEIGSSPVEEYETCPVTIDDCVADTFSVSAEAFNCDCATTVTNELRVKMARSVRKGYATFSKKLAEKLATGVGTSYDGETYLKLKLFCEDLKGKLELQPQGTYAIKQEILKQAPNCVESPIIVTGSEKVAAYQHFAAGGFFDGTQTAGQNASALGDNIYYDPVMAEALSDSKVGCDGAVSFIPGSISLLEWYCFDNPNYSTTPNGRVSWAPQFVGQKLVRQKVDIGTPILGVPFVVDLQIQYDECAGKGGAVTYKWRKCFDLFKLPQEAFCEGSTYNFCNLWEVVCEPYTCGDICTPCPEEG